MRIIAYFTKSTEPVPFNNQSVVNGYIHKCLGKENTFHDSFSDYSISSLFGGVGVNNEYLSFKKPMLIISSKNDDFLSTIIGGLNNNKKFEWGMEFSHIDFVPKENYIEYNYFHTISPILFKDENGLYVTIENPEFNNVLTEKTKKKLLHYVSESELVDFKIEKTDSGFEKVRRLYIHGNLNHASLCNLKITCNKKVADLLFNLGLGKSTGSGFGCICKTENIRLYK